MQVMKAMYGRPAHLNYWMGGSQGGREGLEAITRYPNDYNGAVVAVPLAYFSSLLVNPPYQAAAQIPAASWIPPAKQSLVARFVLKKCDGLDGATDGVINDYLACDNLFDPTITPHPFAALRCPGGADTGNTCLSDPQIATLAKIYGPLIYDYSLAAGENYYPGWGTGMEGISPWLWEETQPTAGQTTDLGGGWSELQALFSGNTSGTFDLGDFSLTALKDKIQKLSQEVDISENLSGWLARGGKLIMLTNASDSISNPRAQMMLYNSWVARYGLASVERSVKYYVQPNESHFEGGVDAEGRALPTEMDLTGTLTRWVEQGTTPPDQLVATNMTATAPYTVTYSKPVCTYPEYPRYRGAGALTDASSYFCSSPLSDLAQLVSSDRLSPQLQNALEQGIDRVSSSLDSSAAACRSADSLIAFIRAAEGNGGNSLTGTRASALIASATTEWLAIGCQTLGRTVQSPR
jgi:feruloyl esterase